LTVEENVGFFLIENLKLPSEEVEKNVVKILKFLNMEDTRNLYPSELSGGMKKRVAIARAVVVNPEVLLYDEPVEGLDPITAKKVVDLINNLTEEYGYTSLIVTHEISHFQGSVNRLLLLDRKTITYDGKVDPEIFNQVEEFNKR
jgi:phospholipid/cholesterol/gamma-HCH transport system ATP-binding protein